MRAEISHDVAALLEQLDRRIEESQALQVELRQKTAERRALDQAIRQTFGLKSSPKPR